MNDVLVIGAGAAGIMAALAAKEAGARVTVFEKNDIVGKKMGITGKGRCNLTNACPIEDFIGHTPGHGKFLFSPYQQFTNEDLLAKLHAWGLETKVERGGRVFPVSDSAIEVRKFFYHLLRHQGIDLHLEEPVQAVKAWGDTFIVQTTQGRYEGNRCIVATGGMTYPSTGSTGDGYAFAKSFGHTVTALKPSLVPFVTKETWPTTLSGMTLRHVEASLWKEGKQIAAEFGDLQCMPFGVSGPIILRLSSVMAHQKKYAFPLQLRINIKPALTKAKLEQRIQRDFQTYIRQSVAVGMKDLLPQKLIPIVLDAAGIDEQMPLNQVTKEQRQDLVDTLQALCLTVTGTRPLAEGIVTAGGIHIKEVNPKTMESKLVRHLYIAGEVLDVDAFTGGYNLQAAFSTGYVAGKAAAEEE